MAETQNCEEKTIYEIKILTWNSNVFWVQPLLKSSDRAEEFHLLTEELHHGRGHILGCQWELEALLQTLTCEYRAAIT